MQLAKQNFLQITFSEQVLSSNFAKIELEFRNMKKQIQSLRESYQSNINSMNDMDQLDFAQYASNWNEQDQQNIDNQKKQEYQQRNLLKENNGASNFGEQQNKINQLQLQTGGIQNIHQNQMQKTKKPNKPDNRQYSHFNKTKNNSSQSMVKQLIKDLETRMKSLQQQKNKKNNQIQNLEKDNIIFKKMLGVKQNKSKQKKQQTTQADSQPKGERKKSKQIKSQEINMDDLFALDNIYEQNNIVTAITKQFNQLKEYLKSKIMQFQNTVDKCITTLDQNKAQLTGLQKESHCTKQKIFTLESTQSRYQTQLSSLLNQTTSLQNVMSNKGSGNDYHKLNSQHSKTRNSISDQGNLNDTVQSYKNYYEDKIVQIFDQMDRIRSEYYQVIQKLKGEQGTDIERLKNIAEKISFINNPTQQKLKKQISSLKRQIKKIKQEFDSLMGDLNTGAGQTRTLVIKPNQNKQDWKQVTVKIYKLRQELLSYVKELQTKINLNNDLTIVIQQLGVGLNQCKILNGKKVNLIDHEKTWKRIQNRLNNFIRQICQKQGMVYEQEAMIAKQPWFCLSCDGEIKNFTGKLAKTVYNQKMVGKKVNPQSHMVRRPQPKLPSVH